MSSSQIDLANSAILKVGGKRINSFKDKKAEAIVVNEFYQRSYDYLLSSHYWGFALTVSDLAQMPTKPLKEYAYAYALPNDVLRIQRTFPNCNYKIVGRELHCDLASVAIKYSKRVPEEELPIYFEQAFMYYLAEQITIPITENQKKADSNYAKYKDHIKSAKSQDSQQYPQDGFEDFPVDDSRYGSGFGRAL